MISPERLWLLSIALRERGHRRLATLVRNVNSALYHNSLPPGASVSPDIELGHHGLGVVVHPNVVIGRRVKIWHNVTIATRAGSKSPYRIVIEDDVKIGANSVIISPYRGDLRIGRGARIGAGAVVSRDVPAGSTVVSAPVHVSSPGEPSEEREPERAGEAPLPGEADGSNGARAGQAGVSARAPVPPRRAEPLA
jgi:serine O-acetyltransferase